MRSTFKCTQWHCRPLTTRTGPQAWSSDFMPSFGAFRPLMGLQSPAALLLGSVSLTSILSSSQASDQAKLSQIHSNPSLKPHSLCHASSRTALAKFHRVGELNGRYLCKLVAVNMSRFCDTWLYNVIEPDDWKMIQKLLDDFSKIVYFLDNIQVSRKIFIYICVYYLTI